MIREIESGEKKKWVGIFETVPFDIWNAFFYSSAILNNLVLLTEK